MPQLMILHGTMKTQQSKKKKGGGTVNTCDFFLNPTHMLSSSSEKVLLINGYSPIPEPSSFLFYLSLHWELSLYFSPSFTPFRTFFNWQTHNLIIITHVFVWFCRIPSYSMGLAWTGIWWVLHFWYASLWTLSIQNTGTKWVKKLRGNGKYMLLE